MFIIHDGEKLFVDRKRAYVCDMDNIPAGDAQANAVINSIRKQDFKYYNHADVVSNSRTVGALYEGKNRMFICTDMVNYSHVIGKPRTRRRVECDERYFNLKYDFDFLEKPTMLNLIAMCRSIGPMLFRSNRPDIVEYGNAETFYRELLVNKEVHRSVNLLIAKLAMQYNIHCVIAGSVAWLSDNGGMTYFGLVNHNVGYNENVNGIEPYVALLQDDINYDCLCQAIEAINNKRFIKHPRLSTFFQAKV